MISPFCVAVVKEFDGFFPHVYLDPVGKRTIGYGHLMLPHETMTILNEDEADALLRADLRVASGDVEMTVATLVLAQHELDALTSFVFNLGVGNLRSSTLLRVLRNGDRRGAGAEFLRWVWATKPNGDKVKLPGLVKRRHAESVWFLGASEQTVLFIARGKMMGDSVRRPA